MSNTKRMGIIPTNEMCLSLANRLIYHSHLPISEVTCLDNIDANFIVSIFEAITDTNVPDLIICENKVEEAHNIQAVIDTLSLDLLGISLSHITGEGIVGGDLVAIYNLLQVLEEVMPHFSTASRVLKRKVRKKHSRSFKENLHPRKKETKVTTLPKDIQASSLSNERKSISAKLKEKPALIRSRFKIRDSKPYRKISSKSSFQESSVFSTVSSHEIHKGTSEKQPSTTSKNSSHKDVNNDNLVQDISADSHPKFEKDMIIEKYPTQGKIESNKNNCLSSSKPSVMKRKISKLPVQKIKTEYLVAEKDIEKLFEENFKSKVKTLIETNNVCKTRSSQMRRNHLQLMNKPLKRPPMSPCRKSYLLPYALRRRSATPKSRKTDGQRQIGSKKFFSTERPMLTMEREESSKGFIQELMEEFPSIQLSPALMNHIRAKYEQQLFKMHQQVKDHLLKKSKADTEAEKAAKRQLIASDLLTKDLQDQQYLKGVQDKRKNENKIKYQLRDARLKSAKMKQYCSEFQDEMRKKMLKRNIAQELIFERVFKEVMNIQKEHVDYLCQQVKETSEEDAQQYLNYLVSLENLYKTQFALLSETVSGEMKDAKMRVNAEKLELNKMQRDFQEVLKREIRFMQKTIVELTEDNHFRELDAEQCIEEMRKHYV